MKALSKFFRAFGVIAIGVVIMTALGSCEQLLGLQSGYTFRFKVKNNSSKTIAKIVFINGDKSDGRVLEKTRPDLSAGETSSEYKISGFTKDYVRDTRKCGVKVTYDDDTTKFSAHFAIDESKILVTVQDASIKFSNGYW
jgi:hypothetical protein